MHMPPRRDFLTQIGALSALSTLTATAQSRDGEKPRIKIGQIGVGHGHANKLAVFRQSPDFEVVGIVEPDAKLRQQAEGKAPFSGLPWMMRDQLLQTPGLQAVLIETRVANLLDQAEVCVNAGKHIHLDKPAGESLPQFKRILDSAQKQKLLVQMGYMYRYNPGVVLLRELLKKGWLGEVFEINAVMSKQLDPAARRDLGQFRGGTMFELGCHLIDLIVAIAGKPQKVTPFPLHSGRLDDGLQDNMLAVLSYPKASVTVRSSGLEVEGFDRRHLTVCGTEGTLHLQPLDSPSARLALSQPRGMYRKGYQEIKLPKYNRYIDDAADMARILRGEKKSDYSYEHDLTVQETLLRASGYE